jgi:hypothetical protein
MKKLPLETRIQDTKDRIKRDRAILTNGNNKTQRIWRNTARRIHDNEDLLAELKTDLYYEKKGPSGTLASDPLFKAVLNYGTKEGKK